MDNSRNIQKGTVLIISLVLLSTFLVIMIAWSRFASLQSHVTVDQGAEERAFQASEAGVEYVLFLLDNNLFSPLTLPYFVQEIVGESDYVFEVSFTNKLAESVTVLSRGYDFNKLNKCQQITAEVKVYEGSLSDKKYYVDSWIHEPNTACATITPSLLPILPAIIPSPAPSPLPSPSP
jgi:hypothetical protein